MKNFRHAIPVFAFLFLGIWMHSSVYADSKQSDSYISFEAAGFLPVYTMSLKMNYVMNPLFTWGYGIDHYWVEGIGLDAEVFGKLTLFNSRHYELPLSFGLVAGWTRGGSFGVTPGSFFGLGLHLEVTPFVFKVGDWGVSLLSCGVISQFDPAILAEKITSIQQFTGLAAGVYIAGVGVRRYF
jgi:hypothetical protein